MKYIGSTGIMRARRQILARRSDYEVDQTLEQRYLHNGIIDTSERNNYN